MSDDDGMEGIEDVWPATRTQTGMLFETLQAPDKGVNLGLFGAELPADLDIARFKSAWATVVARHQSLRSQLLWEGLSSPLQVVHEEVSLAWEDLDWRGGPDGRDALLEDWRTTPFDPSRLPLMRVALARHDTGFAFFWLSHHALIDDWSVAVILEETQAVYHGDTLPKPMPARAFADWLAGRDEEADAAHWVSRLQGLDAPTRLGLASPVTPPAQTAHVADTLSLSAKDTSALSEVARSLRVTLGSVLSVAWGVAVHRLSGQMDVAFGMAATQRPAELHGADRAVGNFVATQPTRLSLQCRSLRELIIARGAEALADQDRAAADLSALASNFELSPGALPFDSILAINENHAAQSDKPFYHQSELRNFSSLPLAMVMRPGAALDLTVLTDPVRFDSVARQVILEVTKAALVALPRHLNGTVADLPLCAPPDDVGPELISQPLLPASIAAQTEAKPDHPAIIDGTGTHSYAALDALVGLRAGQLRAAGVSAGDRVAVFLDRGVPALAGYLAAWRVGATYVPLDPGQDDALIAQMIAAGQVAVVLTDPRLRPRLDRDLRMVLTSDPTGTPVSQVPVTDHDLAYIMFTSGSTGTPKGVMISHANLAASNAARMQWYDRRPERYLVLSPFGFDSSVAGIYWTLASGGTLIVPDADTVRSTAALARLINREKVTHTLCLPALYDLILTQAGQDTLTSLRTVIVAGEATAPPLIAQHAAQMPQCQLVNEYGPTEATVWCTATELQSTDAAVTIGRAIPGVRARVCDANGLAVPDGVPGELWVAGAGVARGYFNQPDLTDDSFVTKGDLRFYKTGDLVRRLPTGQLTYLGRTDDQVKIRGQRIELNEVDAALMALPGVTAGAAVAVAGSGGLRLVAYVTGSDSVDVTTLPQRLQPHHVVRLDHLPQTPTGKVDRTGLRKRGLPQAQTVAQTPATQTEETVAAVWQSILGLDALPDVETGFFALGGDSLMAMRLIGEIAETLGREISVAQMLGQANTVRTMAAALDDGSIAAAPAQATYPAQASTSQAALWFAARMNPKEPFFNLAQAVHLDADISPATVQGAMQALAKRHDILTCQLDVQDRQLWLTPRDDEIVLHVDPRQDTPVEDWLQQAVELPFDMSSGPLWRVNMRPPTSGGTDLVLVVHHTICDGWSLDVLIADFARLLAGHPLADRRHSNFASFLATPAPTGNAAFWQNLLADAPAMPPLSQIPNRPTKAQAKGVYRSQVLDTDTTARLVALAKRRSCSVFVPLWAGTARYLAQATGQPDTLVAVSHANRHSADFQGTVGCFTQALPYRLDARHENLLDLAAARMHDIRQHQDVDASQLPLPKTTAPRGYLSAFTPVALQYNDFGRVSLQDCPGTTTIDFTPQLTSYFELSIEWRMAGDRLHCGILARADLFSEQALETVLADYCDAVAAIG